MSVMVFYRFRGEAFTTKKKILSILIVLTLIVSCAGIPGFAYAAETDVHDGYIVKVNQEGEGPDALRTLGIDIAAHGLVHAADEVELALILENAEVLYWEPNYKAELTRLSDEYYSRQWNLDDIGSETAWTSGFRGSGARVAIIDTGLYANHEDLRNTEILTGMSLYDGTGDVTDTDGHGTMVTGVIAAQADNGLGIAGIADQVTILPLKCFKDEDDANVMDICLGIYKAVDVYKCDVINLSLGSLDDSWTLREASKYASDQGVILVAAVGNDGNADYMYPAAYDCVIGVGSYDKSGTASAFSQKNDSVFVSAPGSDIYSTYIGSSDSYGIADGTSFSAPHVAALAAIAKSHDPTINTENFKQLLIESSDDAGAPGYDTDFGHGKINVAAFVELLQSGDYKPAFDDISGHWAEEYIVYCNDYELLSGTGDGAFSPDVTMSRAMLVTVLYRLTLKTQGTLDTDIFTEDPVPVENTPSVHFTDIEDSAAWFYDAVYWAVGKGIVNGMGDGSFMPDAPVSREQFAAILYRYYGAPVIDSTTIVELFSDSADISEYAVDAMTWCYTEGIIGGMEANMLNPGFETTRAQAAKMIAEFYELVSLTVTG